MNFVELKSMVWPNGKTQAILFYGLSGWKARVWYNAKRGEVFNLGEGPDVFTRSEAEKKLQEAFNGWSQSQNKKR